MVVIDDYLDLQFLNKIEADTPFWSDMGTYSWYSGWWNKPPVNLREELITKIWSDPELWKLVDTPIEGFEHWVGIHNPKSTHVPDWIENAPDLEQTEWALDPHVDKDEGAFKEDESIFNLNPAIGTIFYPWPNKIEGGYLRVWQSRYDSEGNKTADISYKGQYETIEPKYNRLIIFPDFREVHAVEPITKGERRAIAINLWINKPSTDLKSY